MSDPAWYQLWRVMQTFRRQYTSSPVVADFWGTLLEKQTTSTQGPFGKVLDVAHSVGLQIDETAGLWFSRKRFLDLTTCSEPLLERILLHCFHRTLAGQLQHMKGYEDLDGFDYDLTTCCE